MENLNDITIEEIKKSIKIYKLAYEKTQEILGISVMQNLETNNHSSILQFFTIDAGNTYKETTYYFDSGKDKEEETYTAKEDLIYVRYATRSDTEEEEVHATRAFPIRWLFLNKEELEKAKAEEIERKQTEKERELYEKLKLKFENH